ncbi:DUF4240 domain-containing protein [Streptomyces sp. NPDC001904]|uniref:DUF4240 domain-containing protein n=1 Tax=Streptomyces sp. NPDC001904 TaxID=3154531 RepID=UPI00332E8C1C
MDIDAFWSVIEEARTAAAATGEPFDEVLVGRLAAGPRPEILEYARHFDDVHGALYRWDVWAAAYLIGGGCSDDSFTDFRAGVVALGREWYDRVAGDPDSIAAHPDVAPAADEPDRPETLFRETVNYAPADAFERLTGDPDAFWAASRTVRGTGDGTGGAAVDMGEDFDFDDDEMRRRLPRLAALFLGPAR